MAMVYIRLSTKDHVVWHVDTMSRLDMAICNGNGVHQVVYKGPCSMACRYCVEIRHGHVVCHVDTMSRLDMAM